jgi:hypothetical protein
MQIPLIVAVDLTRVLGSTTVATIESTHRSGVALDGDAAEPISLTFVKRGIS